MMKSQIKQIDVIWAVPSPNTHLLSAYVCACTEREVLCTVQGRPSTVASLNSCPTVKVMWVVRTVVEVLMDSVSPSCVISTRGLEAAFTAIKRSILFTAGEDRDNMTKPFWDLHTSKHSLAVAQTGVDTLKGNSHASSTQMHWGRHFSVPLFGL